MTANSDEVVPVKQQTTTPDDRRSHKRLYHPTRISTAILLFIDLTALVVASILFRWTPETFAAFVAVLMLALLGRGYYRTRMQTDLTEDAASILVALALSGSLAVVFLALKSSTDPKLSTMVQVAVATFIVLIATRITGYAVLRRIRKAGLLRSRALLIGSGPIAVEIAVELQERPALGVDIVGHIPQGTTSESTDILGPRLEGLTDLPALIDRNHCDRAIFAVSSINDPEIVHAIRSLLPAKAAVFVLPQLFELGLGFDSMSPDTTRGYALVRVGRSAHPQIALRQKRILDAMLATLLLILLSPILLLVALLVRLSSRGPILFRQQRVGKGGKVFELLKFRSMHVNDDSDTTWTPDLSSGGGTTRIGQLLRRTSLDELPQLINIVRGDMSFVGPRPERPAFVEAFSKSIPSYEDRDRMPAGLTGLAQANGLRGDTPLRERVKYDNLYIDQWSLAADLRILLRTGWSIVRQQAYAEAELTLTRALSVARSPEPTDTIPVDSDKTVAP